jgi:anti-anti-sigma factor
MSASFSPVIALALLHFDTSYPAPGTTRVIVSGEIDLSTAGALRDRLLQVLREQAPAVLDVDLARVTFLDCAGVGALVAVRNAAVHAGIQMRVTHLQRIARRVLDLVGLLDVLTAPIDLPQPRQTGSGQPSRTAVTPSTATPLSRVIVAA